jgi:Transposase Tn5 dimerisation domain
LYQAPIIGSLQFTLPNRTGKKSRIVNQTIRAKKVIFLPSKHKKDLPKVSVNAVLLQEENPPEGEEPVVWMFLTSLPIDTFEDILLIIDLYLSRWGIELFFKVLKSGCKIEELRFQEASRLLVCIAIYMVVAWRILYSTFIGRTCPQLPCTVLFDIDEWQSVYATIEKAKPPTAPPNLDEFMKMIATLGGYRGRKSDGPPGIKVIWIGMQAMHRLAEGWRAYRQFG